MNKPPLHAMIKKALLHGASNPTTVQEKTNETLKCTSDYGGMNWSFDVALYSGCVVYRMDRTDPSEPKCIAFYDKNGKESDLHEELEKASSATKRVSYDEDSCSFDDHHYDADEDYEHFYSILKEHCDKSEEISKKKPDIEGWNVWVRFVRPKVKKHRK